MKKFLTFIISICLVLALSSCALMGYEKPEETQLTVESVYLLAKENGYEGTLEDFINAFKGEAGADGEDGKDGKAGKNGLDGVGIKSATVNETGHLIIEYTDSTTNDAGVVVITPDYERIIPSIGTDGNWYIDGSNTGVPANAEAAIQWHTGESAPDDNYGRDGDFYLSTTTLNVYYKDTTWSMVGSIAGGLGGALNSSSEMSQAAISRALLSAVSVICEASSSSYQTGSGVIYRMDKSSGDAYIITNHHVVFNDSANKVFDDEKMSIYLYGLEYDMYAIPVEYVGGSANYDIAVLKVTDSDVLKNSSARAVLTADSDDVAVLDSVIAVGNPLGGGLSATRGAVNVTYEMLDTDSGDGMRVMRIDAAVNKGNSGGGLFNTNGELVGIVDAKIIQTGVEGIGYVIPSNIATAVADNIIYYCDGNANTNGMIPTFGLQLQVIGATIGYDEDTEKIVSTQQIKIINITKGSIADDAGLLFGDIILSIEHNGKEKQITKLYQPIDLRLDVRPLDTVVYKVNRGGTEMTFTMQIPILASFNEIP